MRLPEGAVDEPAGLAAELAEPAAVGLVGSGPASPARRSTSTSSMSPSSRRPSPGSDIRATVGDLEGGDVLGRPDEDGLVDGSVGGRITSAAPPGMTHAHPLADQTPTCASVGRGARRPVPQASVTPAPRSHTSRSMVSGSAPGR